MEAAGWVFYASSHCAKGKQVGPGRRGRTQGNGEALGAATSGGASGDPMRLASPLQAEVPGPPGPVSSWMPRADPQGG